VGIRTPSFPIANWDAVSKWSGAQPNFLKDRCEKKRKQVTRVLMLAEIVAKPKLLSVLTGDDSIVVSGHFAFSG
jgi:hypothetical protein